MPLESASRIDQLVPSNPTSGDQLAQADDHLRLIKSALQGTFPNIKGVVQASHDDLNGFDDRVEDLETEAIRRDGSVAFTGNQSMGGNQITNLGTPTGNQQAATKKYVDDAVSALDAALEKLWPVGSIYMNGSVNTNPATLLGFGTWERFAEGRVLIGAGSYEDSRGESRSFSRGSTGGAYRHKLTVSEMPKHRHRVSYGTTGTGGNDESMDPYSTSRPYHWTSYEGGDQPHNNMQPYIAVVVWRRTA